MKETINELSDLQELLMSHSGTNTQKRFEISNSILPYERWGLGEKLRKFTLTFMFSSNDQPIIVKSTEMKSRKETLLVQTVAAFIFSVSLINLIT